VEIVPLTRLQHITGDGLDVEGDVVNEVAEDGIGKLEDMLLEELEVDMDEVIVDDMELVVVIAKLQIAPLTDPELKEIAPMAYFM
jgi:hypothetical protein